MQATTRKRLKTESEKGVTTDLTFDLGPPIEKTNSRYDNWINIKPYK